MTLSLDTEVHSLKDLLNFYHYVNWDHSLCVGIEWERSGVYRKSFEPVPYAGDKGYLAVLKHLKDEAGWKVTQSEDFGITELKRGEAYITLEGDGRLELAGSPQESIHNLARELRLHANEVVEIGNVFNIEWLSVGMQPFHRNDEIPLLPKERYKIFQGIGDADLMETMTKRNNGLTANLSYTDEKNAIIKAQTAFRVLPIIGAMFACSPFSEGKRAAYLDQRRYVIQRHAPQRTGIPETILRDDFTLEEWIAYYAKIPVVIVRGKKPEKEFTFLEWIENGYQGIKPTIYDFDQHIKTMWSDIRLRPSYLEYRVADSVPQRLILSLPALMKGLLFDSESWNAIRELTENWSYQDVIEADERAWKGGLKSEIQGRSLLAYAQELLIIANEKLHKFERTDASSSDESVYLKPLKEQIFIKEKSPAEELVELYETEWNGDLTRILDWCKYE